MKHRPRRATGPAYRRTGGARLQVKTTWDASGREPAVDGAQGDGARGAHRARRRQRHGHRRPDLPAAARQLAGRTRDRRRAASATSTTSTATRSRVFREFDQNIPVKPADIPMLLKQAVISSEDRHFYSHSRRRPARQRRALSWPTCAAAASMQGGSTITQQYVKNVYVGNERTLIRKVQRGDPRQPGRPQVSTRTRSSSATSTRSTWATAPTASAPRPRPTSASR